MIKSSTSIGMLFIVYSIFLGPLIWLRSSGIPKNNGVSGELDIIISCCILTGLVITGILFLMEKRYAVYTTILTFLLIIIFNLIKANIDIYSFILSIIIPIIFIIYIIRSKGHLHLK